MAIRNKIIRNPKTNQEIRFLQTSKDTNGSLLEMETIYVGSSKEPPPHYHPFQEENFTVLSGELTVRLDHGKRILRAGDTLHILRNQIHSMWNDTDTRTIVNWKVHPALATEYLLETAMGLATDGKTNEEGMPPLLQVAVMADHFSDTFRLSRPPFVIQKLLFGLLTPFGYFAGYRPRYQKYID